MRRRPASRTPSNRSSRPRTRWMRRSSSTQSPPWAVSLSRDREALQPHRVNADVVSSDWGAGPDIPALREALKTPTKAVAVVHNETSTGITNPLEPIVEAAHAVDAAVLVDAVSSLGGLPLPFAKLGIAAAFSASQKCIAAPAGIAPVAVARSLWESTDPKTVEGWYLNLYTWDRYEREWGDWHPTPTTISSNLFYAFHRALTLLKEEGLEARLARHAKVAARLRDGLVELGFSPLGAANLLSHTATCFAPPAGVDANRLVRRLRGEHNIHISGGLDPMRATTLRIGTLGTQADPEIIDWLLKAIRASL